MAVSPLAIIGLLTIIVLHSLFKKFVKIIRHRNIIQLNGCQPPNRYLHKEPLMGMDLSLNTYRTLESGTYLEGYRGHFKTYGNTFEAIVFGKKAIFTAEPINIKAILSDKFEDYNYDATRKRAWASVLGHSIFTADGTAWSECRRLLRPSFAKGLVGDLARLEPHVDNLLHAIHRQAQVATVVDLQPLFYRLTFDTTTDLLFADSELSLLSPSADADESLSHLVDAFNRMIHVMGDRHVLGELAVLITNSQHEKDHADVLRLVDRYVQRALRHRHSYSGRQGGRRKENETRRNVFLEVAAEIDDAEKLRANLLSILFAGRDTTAILLGNLWFVLARNPCIFSRLQNEINQLEGRPPTLQQLKGLAYLRYCVNECKRNLTRGI